jgi:hypothetical protein
MLYLLLRRARNQWLEIRGENYCSLQCRHMMGRGARKGTAPARGGDLLARLLICHLLRSRCPQQEPIDV